MTMESKATPIERWALQCHAKSLILLHSPVLLSKSA